MILPPPPRAMMVYASAGSFASRNAIDDVIDG